MSLAPQTPCPEHAFGHSEKTFVIPEVVRIDSNAVESLIENGPTPKYWKGNCVI
jgi:hypothetical protein